MILTLPKSIVINETVLLPLGLPVMSLVTVVLRMYIGGKFGTV